MKLPFTAVILPLSHYYLFNVLVDLVHVPAGIDAIHPSEQMMQLEAVFPEHVLQEE